MRQLYEGLILEHYRQPRNRRRPEGATHHAHECNTICGDDLTVYVALAGGAVGAAGFEGVGCAVMIASASIMTEHVRGMNAREAAELAERFETVMLGGEDSEFGAEDLDSLRQVRKFPPRVKCACLPWRALRTALDGD